MQDGTSEPAPKTTTPLARQTIVLFEDDDLVRRATERLLRRLGAEVVAGMGSAEVLASLEASGAVPSSVVADYWFTRLEDGVAATEAVRSAFGSEVKGVIVTGDSSSEITQAVEAAGFQLLRKPVNIDHFIAALADNN